METSPMGTGLAGMLAGIPGVRGKEELASRAWLEDIGNLAEAGLLDADAIAWLTSLADIGEWYVPGAGTQDVGEWVGFLSTPQGKDWWGSLSARDKAGLQPDYTEDALRAVEWNDAGEPIRFTPVGGKPGIQGAAQQGSSKENPILALPWLGKPAASLPSEKAKYGVPSGGGTGQPGKEERERQLIKVRESQRRNPLSIFRESPETYDETRRVAPQTRWLLF